MLSLSKLAAAAALLVLVSAQEKSLDRDASKSAQSRDALHQRIAELERRIPELENAIDQRSNVEPNRSPFTSVLTGALTDSYPDHLGT